MANTPSKKKPAEKSRARVEEMRAAQKAAERRRTIILVTVAIVVAVGLIAAVAIPLVLKSRDDDKPVSDIGVSAAAANCGEIFNDPATGTNDHVGVGTASPDITHVDYDSNPPDHGSHFAVPAGIDRHFYTPDDTPPVEQLVHNLEHGYTIVWYDDKVSDSQISLLKDLSERIPNDVPKFIVAPWDETRGDFPDGAGNIAFTHWSTDAGHRQYCGDVSGEALQTFMTQFPYTDSPEPDAA